MSGINIGIGVTGADTAATQLGKVSTSLGGVAKASNTAGQSLTNLGRIAQDAPFGFIGIQNNINPLIESFGRLKAETGSTGGAFKALVGSLAGAGGIGLAVSVVTGALTVLAQKGFFKTAEAADEASKKAKEFQKSIDSIQSSVAAEQANILVLVKALESETTSREKKAAALKQLQQINPQYFGDLTLEGNLVNGLGIAYQKYAASILASVQNKIDKKRLEDVLLKINEAEEKQKRNQLQIAANEAEKNRLIALGGRQYASQFDKINQQLGQEFELVGLARQRDEILQRIASRNFEGTIKFGRVTESTKEAVKKIKKAVEDEKIGRLELPINIQLLTREDAAADIAEANRIAKEKQERLDKLFKNATPINIPLNVRVSDKEKELREYYTQLAKVAQEQQDIFLRAVVDSFVAIGEGLGNIITGKAGFGELFAGIGQIFGSALKELGKSVIEASTLIASLKKALNAAFAGNPILGVIAGVALIALGTVIQNSLPKFANGVTNFGGGMALVGERGPEIVRLPSGSDVIPNFRLNSLSASQPTAYIPNVTLRGSDLVIAFNRQTATNRRNG